MYRQVYTMYNPCTTWYIPIKSHNSWYISCMYKYNYFSVHFRVHTHLDIHEIYTLIGLCTNLEKQKLPRWGIKTLISCIESSRLHHCASSADTKLNNLKL
jgi:hypothetical protein